MKPTSNPIAPGANTAILTNGAPPTICKICVQYAFARHRYRLATGAAAGTLTAENILSRRPARSWPHPSHTFKETRKARVYEGPRKVRVKDIAEPKIQRPTDVLSYELPLEKAPEGYDNFDAR